MPYSSLMKAALNHRLALIAALVLAGFSAAFAQTAQDYYDQGLRFMAYREFDQAITALTAAIQLDPNHVGAYFYRGHAYLEEKDINRAIADWEAVLRIDPTNENARKILELVRQKTGR